MGLSFVGRERGHTIRHLPSLYKPTSTDLLPWKRTCPPCRTIIIAGRTCRRCDVLEVWTRRARRQSPWGGGGAGGPFPNPPPSLNAVPGGRVQHGGCPTCCARGGGGGSTPTYMAQNDPHVVLIIDYTYVGEILGEKNLFRAKISVAAASAPTSIVTQNKGPGTEAWVVSTGCLSSAGTRSP